MEPNVLRNFLESNHATLDCWGLYVKETIAALLPSRSVSIQMQSHRVKEIDSAVGKITRKGYDDPLAQMTDLVGVRFVVLLSPSLNVIGELIETNENWEYSKDKDPGEETEANAEKFGYQSLHYVVRSRREIIHNGVVIPKGLPCEVQIRTLLQHAYAEVVHDSIYKAVGRVPPKANRFVARSMALIETTDHLFCETMKFLEEENKSRNEILDGLMTLYVSQVGVGEIGPDAKLNLSVIEAFRSQLSENTALQVAEFCGANSFVAERIKSRQQSDPFWSQPVSLLAYWLVEQNGLETFNQWPFASSHDALRLVYSDLGVSRH